MKTAQLVLMALLSITCAQSPPSANATHPVAAPQMASKQPVAPASKPQEHPESQLIHLQTIHVPKKADTRKGLSVSLPNTGISLGQHTGPKTILKLDESAKEQVVKDVTDAITEGLLNNKKGILRREKISESIHQKMEQNRQTINSPPNQEAKPKELKKQAAPAEKTKNPAELEESAAISPSKIEAEVKDKILSKINSIDKESKKTYTKEELKEKVSLAAKHSAEVAISQYKDNLKKRNIKLKQVGTENTQAKSEVEEVAKVATKELEVIKDAMTGKHKSSGQAAEKKIAKKLKKQMTKVTDQIAPASKATKVPEAKVPEVVSQPAEPIAPALNFIDALKQMVEKPRTSQIELNTNAMSGVKEAMSMLNPAQSFGLGNEPFIRPHSGIQGLTQMGFLDETSDEWA